MTPCLFCGGDGSAPDHWRTCKTPLFARQSDPDTSQESMDRYDQERMKSAMTVVVGLHRGRGPMADYELRAAFDDVWTEPCCDHLYRQARTSARDRGLIRDSGVRRVNPTTNRRQVVWEACDVEPVTLERCTSCGHILRRQGAA